jgi:hypothetical protein
VANTDPLNIAVADSIQSGLEIEKGFETTRPADRRRMIRDLKDTIAAFQAVAEAIDRTDPWTTVNLQPLAFSYGADIPLRDVKDMLGAYLDAAAQLKNDLEASRPERGPNPEYPLRVASTVMTILGRAGIALDDREKGPLVVTITSRDVADRYGVTDRTLVRWAHDPELGFPQPSRINSRKYYDEDALIAWDRKRTMTESA